MGGGTVATDANVIDPVTTVQINAITKSFIKVRRLAVWSFRLPDAKLKQLTAP
jgi:hypothetical protein